MAGIFTDTEDKSSTLLQYSTTGVNIPPSVVKIRIPDLKETTSYRSGRELSEEEEIRQNSSIYRPTRFLSSPEDTGHEFQSVHMKLIRLSHPHVVINNGYGTGLPISGPLVITTAPIRLTGILPMSNNDQVLFGSRAISSTIPTRSDASLTNLIGELARDGIPSIIGSLFVRSKNIRSLGGEYLNVEFGWKPLVSDIMKLMKSVKNSSQTIQQLRRDSGRVVRRRFSFPETTDITSSSYEPSFYEEKFRGIPSGASNVVSLLGPVLTTNRVSTRIWFSGAYTYYLDPGDNLLNKMVEYEALANKVLGTRLTPSVLWELAPWSWLVDWFSNVGTALSNASALSNDGLVIKYGYLMRHTVLRKEIYVSAKLGTLFKQGDTQQGPFHVTNSYLLSRKERWKASPYGFGLNLTSLSVRQWAILVALGLTNAPRPMG